LCSSHLFYVLFILPLFSIIIKCISRLFCYLHTLFYTLGPKLFQQKEDEIIDRLSIHLGKELKDNGGRLKLLEDVRKWFNDNYPQGMPETLPLPKSAFAAKEPSSEGKTDDSKSPEAEPQPANHQTIFNIKPKITVLGDFLPIRGAIICGLLLAGLLMGRIGFSRSLVNLTLNLNNKEITNNSVSASNFAAPPRLESFSILDEEKDVILFTGTSYTIQSGYLPQGC